jgi:hypothetical protein
MKRYTNILGVLATAVLLLSGCVKQQAAWTPMNITFKPLIGHDTRAVESVPFPQDQSFNVWADGKTLGGLYIDGEEISYGAEGWTSSALWPRYELDFEACWPTDLGMEFSSTRGLQFKDFDCSEGKTDILHARTSEINDKDGTAVLRFDHILSRVDFRMLHSLPEGMVVRLKKMVMNGFAATGSFNTSVRYGWETGKSDFTYTVYDAGDSEGIIINAGDARFICDEFYVIPQICTASLEVSYEIRYKTAGWVPQSDTIESLDTYWESSKHYTYTVNLRTDKLSHTTGISNWNNRD